ncbi:MAG: endolytic transglycosylase MltG [Lachnospiraceae bacterium]|nr:endolytic transglycosylase MltG [Lachnospiraceae bacterium]
MKVKTILATVLSAVIKVAVIIWIVTFIYSKAVAAYEFGHRVFTEEAISPAPGREITVSVTEGKSSKDLAKMLAEKGLVRDANLAYVQILCSEYRKEIKPGVYTLTTAMRIEEMLKIMAEAEEEEEKNDG